MQIDEIFNKHGTIPTIYAESTSVTFMRELAILGGGVALLPDNFVKEDLDQGRLKIQKMPMQWNTRTIFPVESSRRGFSLLVLALPALMQ